MATAAARSSSLRAPAPAATETHVSTCGGPTIIKMEKIDKSSCSVRVHGDVIVRRESRKIGATRSTSEHHETPPDFWKFDHRMDDQDPWLFRSHVACRDLIHRMLAEGPVTGRCDLAADNWEDFEPHDTAKKIVDKVRRDNTEDACGVAPAAYAFDIQMAIYVRLVYSEPKALLLACKEAETDTDTEALDAFALSRKRRREPAGELCVICLSEEGTKDEETVCLPCSHAFHDRCIRPWFHRSSTCPTCRHDAMGHFDFVTSASAWSSFTYRDIEATTATSTTTEEP